MQRFKPSFLGKASAKPSSRVDERLLPELEDAPLFSVDLMDGHLAFSNPPSQLAGEDFWRGFAWDRRPLVNSISRSEYQIDPLTPRFSCTLYETGWAMTERRWWQRQRLAVLKFSVFLECPADAERSRFPDLRDESDLNAWLGACYRDRQANADRFSFSELADGGIAMDVHDPPSRLTGAEADSMLSRLPASVGGQPCYCVYLNPGILECTIARTAREVVQFRFQLRPESVAPVAIDRLKPPVMAFAQSLLQTVRLESSPSSGTVSLKHPER